MAEDRVSHPRRTAGAVRSMHKWRGLAAELARS